MIDAPWQCVFFFDCFLFAFSSIESVTILMAQIKPQIAISKSFVILCRI